MASHSFYVLASSTIASKSGDVLHISPHAASIASSPPTASAAGTSVNFKASVTEHLHYEIYSLTVAHNKTPLNRGAAVIPHGFLSHEQVTSHFTPFKKWMFITASHLLFAFFIYLFIHLLQTSILGPPSAPSNLQLIHSATTTAPAAARPKLAR